MRFVKRYNYKNLDFLKNKKIKKVATMTNFDFLKSMNVELYELGVKLEEDVINSPRAVTADATLFLEALVKDIYKKTKNKLESNLISFYKKIDNLYRLGAISYIYKNKLQDAYNLRNKIHKNYQDIQDEINLAFELHKRLYYISKKYFRDFCDNDRLVSVPDYKKPENRDIHFDNCIICGCVNEDPNSNMCRNCNRKIDNANLLLGIRNQIKQDFFTKQDIINYGIGESQAISILMDLSKENILLKKGEYYEINESQFNDCLKEIDEYIEIGLLLNRFYKDEMTPVEVKCTAQYKKGGVNQKPYAEFYRLVNLRFEKTFEKELYQSEDIKKSMKKSSMDQLNVIGWFSKEKELFINGDLNDSFILFNEILIRQYFGYKRKGFDEDRIKKQLMITDEMLIFWKTHFMGDDFLIKSREIKKGLILKEIKKNKTLKEALKTAGMNEKEFDKMYILSQNRNDEFYQRFNIEYVQKRKKTVIKHLRNNNLNKAVRLSKITKNEFLRWYYKSEINLSDFYMEVTEILMDKYLKYRENGMNKKDILKRMNISRDMFKSWDNHEDLNLFIDFKAKNKELTSNLIKRGKIINGLKDDKSKEEAIFSAGLTPREFLEIYNKSKRERSDFHQRFDEEYEKNRKRLFPKLLEDNNFYEAIQKCEISQKEFNQWYLKDQDKFFADKNPSAFYLNTTLKLMDYYIESRRKGKNRPDSARSVGLSNIMIDKWLKHDELEIFRQFRERITQLTIELIAKGFNDIDSREEISEKYDIPISTIDEYICLGKRGAEEYVEIFELYEDRVIPTLLKSFLDEFETKTFNKALKNSKITVGELNHYYDLGKSEDGKFHGFHQSYLSLKIRLYVNDILSRKSQRIALKNSNLTKAELKDNEDEINGLILKGRFNIIDAELQKGKTTGVKLAKTVGVSVEELYGWYIKGKEGDETFEEFSLMFELSVILPRTMAFNYAVAMGIPKNWAHKQLKKTLGSKEYKIWNRHGIIDQKEMNYIKIDGENIDEEKIIKQMKNSEFFKCCIADNDSDIYDLMKQAVQGNSKFSKTLDHVSKGAKAKIDKNEIIIG
jgi:hypothetical protein